MKKITPSRKEDANGWEREGEREREREREKTATKEGERAVVKPLVELYGRLSLLI